MSSDIAIEVENVGKCYRVNHQPQQSGRSYTALRDVISEKFITWLPNKSHQKEQSRIEEFWALKDISFQIKKGEAVGVIGRNGAGKSTLLKVLSRITAPTLGGIGINGRVASLLEVGTGFHPELTGRENIYLNGAIIGMKRTEIRSKFDEIVAFAEVDKFIDTPVKRYSSGMYMRLAFAVAAHLESDILIIDEVLAVGDSEFQAKCIGKMKSVTSSGKTIIFVSHNLQAVRTLCQRALLLERGENLFIGDRDLGLQIYADRREYLSSNQWARPAKLNKAPLMFQALDASVVGIQPKLDLQIKIEMRSNEQHKPAFLAIDILDETGVPLMQAIPKLSPFINFDPELHFFDLVISLPPMVPGIYVLTFWTGPHNSYTYDSVEEVIQFEIIDSPTAGRTVPHYSPDHGFIVPDSTIQEREPI